VSRGIAHDKGKHIIRVVMELVPILHHETKYNEIESKILSVMKRKIILT
jgi:hypothetical protein